MLDCFVVVIVPLLVESEQGPSRLSEAARGQTCLSQKQDSQVEDSLRCSSCLLSLPPLRHHDGTEQHQDDTRTNSSRRFCSTGPESRGVCSLVSASRSFKSRLSACHRNDDGDISSSHTDRGTRGIGGRQEEATSQAATWSFDVRSSQDIVGTD